MLYDIFNNPFAKAALASIEIPTYIKDNLKHTMRPYQEEALKRFLWFMDDNNIFEGKQRKPYHLLFNMATGSGKTLIMAALILYYYEKGYRNFIFFVSSNNIIKKTKENFANTKSTKYEFAKDIMFNTTKVIVKDIKSFEEANENNINIKFASIQSLTSGLLTNIRENGISFEDFENKKTILIGDEAHHNNADVWGNLVERIHKMSLDNVLLEFTATTDYEEPTIKAKYENKVLYRYDLKQFRRDKYSKDIYLLRSNLPIHKRVLLALILNIYRQALAAKYLINLKPVILFKSRTIAESVLNINSFILQVESLNESDINDIEENNLDLFIQKAFDFFKAQKISNSNIVNRIKFHFKSENILSVNDDEASEINQIRLNNLEDIDNPIRAIFAVQKLNEGWDVLNLFDIVRLYETRDGKNGIGGKTTISEAQLIGRGARYFPFTISYEQDLYKRKYDEDPDNELRGLELLFYHSLNDSKYISELKQALISTGIIDNPENTVVRELKLKDNFKKTDFYKDAIVFYNKKRIKNKKLFTSFCDIEISSMAYEFSLSSNFSSSINIFSDDTNALKNESITYKDVNIKDIQINIIQFALTKNPFFRFDNLSRLFSGLSSISQFITDSKYLGKQIIRFKGSTNRINFITNDDYLRALDGYLLSIENYIKAHKFEEEGTPFTYAPFKDIFHDRKLNIDKDDERAMGQEELIADKDWYVYSANYGTPEEKSFVEMFAARFEVLNMKYESLYLVRNERELKIYDEVGRTFEPDFLLFCRKRDGDKITYQIFIEPKGDGFLATDKWKETFLNSIKEKFTGDFKPIDINTDKFVITGLPFYNTKGEDKFREALEETLEYNKLN